jgi:hypothetical protein
MANNDSARGVGKCVEGHIGSYGYPTRPEEPYPYCPQCGSAMVWRCPVCDEPVPHEADELATAHFCRFCGAPYFAEGEIPEGDEHRPIPVAQQPMPEPGANAAT